jgi:glucose-6-phosphate dehydrogenase assembly protein OpcA
MEAAVTSGLEVFRGTAAVDLTRVEQELRLLWKAAADQVVEQGRPPVTRVSTMNLVVLVHAGAGSDEATRAAIELSARHPGRLIVVETREGPDSITASISAHCHLGSGDRQVCSEQVHLVLSGSNVERVAQQVAPLFLPDLPRVTWIPYDPLAVPVTPELLSLSDRMVVDSHHFPDARAAVLKLAEWSEETTAGDVVDLAWVRLDRWRSLTAQLFDDPEARTDLARLDRVEVDYLFGDENAPEGRVEALYYLAWLGERLGLHPTDAKVTGGEGTEQLRVRNDAGREVQLILRRLPREGEAPGVLTRVCLGAAGGGSRYEIERNLERNVAEIRVQVGRSCPRPSRVELPSAGELELMHAALESRRTDPIFNRVLNTARGWIRNTS